MTTNLVCLFLTGFALLLGGATGVFAGEKKVPTLFGTGLLLMLGGGLLAQTSGAGPGTCALVFAGALVFVRGFALVEER